MQSIAKLSEFAGHLRDLIRDTPSGKIPWTDDTFGELALKLFTLQRQHNGVYRTLCQAKGLVQDRKIADWREIPPVPTSAFKDLLMTCLPAGNWTTVFHSSGTTEHRPSRHFHSAESLGVYEESVVAWFRRYLQLAQRIPIICLTPPREAARHSSLVYMFETLRGKFGGESAAFLGRIGEDGGWTLNDEAATEALRKGAEIGEPMLILGTAFSYVHLLDHLTGQNISIKLPAGTVAMETGGYKGRSRALPKEQLHQLICERLGISETQIVCEYGMSELSSQAYDQIAVRQPFCSSRRKEAHFVSSPKDQSLLTSAATRVFHFPPWARVQVISPETGREVKEGETGLIRIFDLANVFSVMAVQTEDLGIRRGNGFELVGRALLAEPRGCSLTEA
jgi:Acyl-protein synthetase, LuxE